MPTIKIIGEDTPQPKLLKPIELVKVIASHGEVYKTSANISTYKNIELICRNYTRDGLDLVFCYDNDRNNYSETSLFLCRWNDGVV